MKYLASEDGFLGLDASDASGTASARAVIVPFGLEASVSYGGGTAAGPEAIINASHQVELFDEVWWKEAYRDYGVATLDYPRINGDIPAALDQLEQTIEHLLQEDKFPLTLGGEHSITAGSIRPFVSRYPDLAILHFDAHADLRDGYDGEHFSHAAALRRVMDYPIGTLVSVGIRNISAGEIPFLDSNRDRIHIHWAKDKRNWNIKDMVEPLRGKPVYLTFDLDGFDGSLMAATGTPEPGGLFWDDAMGVIEAAAAICNIVGADVVELAPREELHACDFLAAKLCYKILNYALARK
ncbi:MAG: agmatinase [Gammaproteobacteria bacterium]